MKIYTSYKVKIKYYNHIFTETLTLYRRAVDFFISVANDQWAVLSGVSAYEQLRYVEKICIPTKNHPDVLYDFSAAYYKFPSYLRRAAITEAIGIVSSYYSNLENWSADPSLGEPSLGDAGRVFPAMYRDNMFIRTGEYTVDIKVFVRNTWDWLSVELRKSDVDYIQRHCSGRKECVPTLQCKGRQWYLVFSFEEDVSLHECAVEEETILAVDLGINNACVCSAMRSDGTIVGRRFLRLPSETDSLTHAINRIKKAQQHGANRTPKLWAIADGINRDIASKTANFIADTAKELDVSTIVFEHLETGGKKRGSKKQRLHLWKSRDVQRMVTDKAHRMGMRIARVNAWGTSRLAFDGSGTVTRGTYMQNGTEKNNHSICVFPNGKTYHCDLNASYNIGARYFIREILKSLPETARLDIEAKVPQCTRRSTCTLSTLFNLNAAITAPAV